MILASLMADHDGMFEVWVARIDGDWRAKHWGDNPPAARLVAVMGGPWPLATARDCARGFNQAEIVTPVGAWAFVVREGAGRHGPARIVQAETLA